MFPQKLSCLTAYVPEFGYQMLVVINGALEKDGPTVMELSWCEGEGFGMTKGM